MYVHGATKWLYSEVASGFEGRELGWEGGIWKFLALPDHGEDEGFAEEDKSDHGN